VFWPYNVVHRPTLARYLRDAKVFNFWDFVLEIRHGNTPSELPLLEMIKCLIFCYIVRK